MNKSIRKAFLISPHAINVRQFNTVIQGKAIAGAFGYGGKAREGQGQDQDQGNNDKSFLVLCVTSLQLEQK